MSDALNAAHDGLPVLVSNAGAPPSTDDRKARGRPVDMRDTFIAGIALARRASLARCI